MKMGDIIKQLRLQKGITQEELGKVIGVQKSAIRKYESGMVENMKRTSIKKMADYFGVSPTYLMGMENMNYETINSPIEDAILTICKSLSEKQKGEVLVYATNLLKINS